MIVGRSALNALLAIYHLKSNARSWNNCEVKGCGWCIPVYQIPLCCEVFHGLSWPPPWLAVHSLSPTMKTMQRRFRISEMMTL